MFNDFLTDFEAECFRAAYYDNCLNFSIGRVPFNVKGWINTFKFRFEIAQLKCNEKSSSPVHVG